MRHVNCRLALLCAFGLATLPNLALAEEGGSGHYLRGSMSDFIDATPQNGGFFVKLQALDYLGSASITKQLPFAGEVVGGPKADVWGSSATLVWRPDIDLGQRWSYAMSVTIPYIGSNISANATASLPNGFSRSVAESSATDAIGDVVLMPLMLNYNVNPDFNLGFRLGF